MVSVAGAVADATGQPDLWSRRRHGEIVDFGLACAPLQGHPALYLQGHDSAFVASITASRASLLTAAKSKRPTMKQYLR